MHVEEALEYVITDPTLNSEEKEMSIGFTKHDEQATIFTAIASQVRRCLTHTDIDVVELQVLNKADGTRWNTTLEDFDGNGSIVSLKAKLPIESLKVQANPRSSRSYAQIISPQNSVNFD